MENKYWARTQMGLENILLEEIIENHTLKEYEKTHRNIIFSLNEVTQNTESDLLKLRVADDIYKFIGRCDNISRKRESLDILQNFFCREIVPKLKVIGSPIRPTASFLGKRNFSRYELEEIINSQLTSNSSINILSNKRKDAWVQGERRLRVHIENADAFFGISLMDKPIHRRKWRINSYEGQLHPSVAAAMVRIANFSPFDNIVDPFCGSATVLIECGLTDRSLNLYGYDISKEAIKIAKQNSKAAKLKIALHSNEFKCTAFNDNYNIISNPPWGEKHEIQSKELGHFYSNLSLIMTFAKKSILCVPQHYTEKIKLLFNNTKVITTTRIKGKIVNLIVIEN